MGRKGTAARVRRYLASLGRRDLAALARVMDQAIAEWGAEGWAITGKAPRLRIAVFVRKKLANPATPISTVELPTSLGGSLLKVDVLALHGAGEGTPVEAPVGLPAGAGVDYLAPGAPIGGENERIGIGAVLAIDGAPHLVTCGHAFDSDDAVITTLDQVEVGTLRDGCNFFISERLDAAVFELNDDGIELLEAGRIAATWATSIHRPSADDNGSEATFWPTWSDDGQPFVEEVLSFSSSTADSGYILLPRCTAEGDSGSTLQLAGAYYGLASSRDGNYSFFTPLDAIKRRLGSGVTTWRPN